MDSSTSHQFELNDQKMQVDDEPLLMASNVRANYELATHTVKVKRSGTLVDITRLWDLEEATTPNAFKIKNDELLFASSSDMTKPQFDRIKSIDFFNQRSQPNEMLGGLRYFERAIKNTGDTSQSR